jgi:hypothetical protein
MVTVGCSQFRSHLIGGMRHWLLRACRAEPTEGAETRPGRPCRCTGCAADAGRLRWHAALWPAHRSPAGTRESGSAPILTRQMITFGSKCMFLGATGDEAADKKSRMLTFEAFLSLYENTKEAKVAGASADRGQLRREPDMDLERPHADRHRTRRGWAGNRACRPFGRMELRRTYPAKCSNTTRRCTNCCPPKAKNSNAEKEHCENQAGNNSGIQTRSGALACWGRADNGATGRAGSGQATGSV